MNFRAGDLRKRRNVREVEVAEVLAEKQSSKEEEGFPVKSSRA